MECLLTTGNSYSKFLAAASKCPRHVSLPTRGQTSYLPALLMLVKVGESSISLCVSRKAEQISTSMFVYNAFLYSRPYNISMYRVKIRLYCVHRGVT